MTELLRKAFQEASKLPAGDQDALATVLLEEPAGERRWDSSLAGSPEKLVALADSALAEHRAGKTQPLDPDTL